MSRGPFHELGWTRIGLSDTTRRRSLWARTLPPGASFEEVDLIELCSGREGGDSYVSFDRAKTASWVFRDLLRVVNDALLVAEELNR